jgi:hypothetical protein
MEFEIFKTGTHTSDKGVTNDYSLDDLNYIAANYKPEEHEAPIVVGHPIDNSPAFGWIEKLEVIGDRLIAKAKDIIPEFKEALDKKLYKKRSVSLDKDGKLRHVGFLGGAAPAVKGLADIHFSEPSGETFELENDEVKDVSVQHSETSIQNQDTSIQKPESSIKYPELPETLINSFTHQLDSISKSLADLAQNYSSDNSSVSSLTTQIEDLKLKFTNSELDQKIDEKIKEGYFTPALKNQTTKLLNHLTASNFSADFDPVKYRTEVITIVNDFIDSMPKIVHFENFAEKPDELPEVPDNYSGWPVDAESKALHKKAMSLMKKENISYQSAVMKLTSK